MRKWIWTLLIGTILATPVLSADKDTEKMHIFLYFLAL